MPTATANKTLQTLVASASLPAGSFARGASDLRQSPGGSLLHARITNSFAGPAVQAVVNVYGAFTTGSTPAAGGQGADWRLLATLGGGGTANNSVTDFAYRVPVGVMHLQVEFGGHTSNPVTVEALLARVDSYTSA